jgi:hypothetical protein
MPPCWLQTPTTQAVWGSGSTTGWVTSRVSRSRKPFTRAAGSVVFWVCSHDFSVAGSHQKRLFGMGRAAQVNQ